MYIAGRAFQYILLLPAGITFMVMSDFKYSLVFREGFGTEI